DLKSLNGTFVDDQPVVHGTPVEVGQHLRFGRVSFELVRESDGKQSSRTRSLSTERWKQRDSKTVLQAVRSLTAAERGVLRLMLKGHSHKEIGKQRHISVHTVNNHLRKIYQAFGVHSRAELFTLVLHRPLSVHEAKDRSRAGDSR